MSGASRNCASPISSARTPPGPNATSGPKTGSCTTPASSSAPPRTNGCTKERRPDALGRFEDGSLAGEVESDAALLGLVRSGSGRLEHDREAELVRRLDRRRGRLRDALRHERHAVRLEQATRLVGVEPATARRQGLVHNAPGLVAVALELGHRARRLAEPLAALDRKRERLRGRLGIGEGRYRGRALQRDGSPFGAEERAEDGLVDGRGGRAADRRADGLLVGADGRDEEDDGGVERRIGEQRRQRPLEALRVGAAEQVDRVRGAALGRHEVGERGARLLARLRQLEAERLAGVRREDSQPAGVRDDGDAPAARHRLGREQRRDVDQLVERARPDHARVREQRVGRSVGAGERRGVRARGADARARRAALQRQDRLAPREPARDARERSRVAEGLEIEHDELGRVVVLPPLEQVVRRDVGLVADRDEGGDAEAAAPPRARAARARARRSGRRSRSCRPGSCAARTSR